MLLDAQWYLVCRQVHNTHVYSMYECGNAAVAAGHGAWNGLRAGGTSALTRKTVLLKHTPVH